MKHKAVLLAAATIVGLSVSQSALAEDAHASCMPSEATVECAAGELAALTKQHETLLMLKKRSPASPSDPTSPYDTRLEFNEQTQHSLRDWFAANAATTLANDKLAAASKRLSDLESMRNQVAAPAALDALLVAERKAESDAKETARKAVADQNEKWANFLLRRNVALAMIIPARELGGQRLAISTPTPAENGKRGQESQKADCSIDTAAARASNLANECYVKATTLVSRLSLSGTTSSGQITIPGRPLERRGIYTSIAGSKDGTVLSIGLSDEFKRRTPYTDGGQRVSTIGYSVSVKTDGGDLLSFKPAKDSDTVGALDRLTSKSSISGSLSYNFFAPESAKSFADRGAEMASAARKACLDELSKEGALVTSCQGEQLVAWIFAVDPKTGEYAHPAHVVAFNSLYFGSPDKYARAGGGISIEYARPSFSFIDAATSTPTQIGQILTAGVKPVRHDSWAISGYAYFRVPEQMPNFDVTLVGSVTYKDSWKQADQALFCPAISTTSPFTTSTCKTFDVAAPDHSRTIVPGAEARMLWRGFRRGRFFVPEIAIAPKLTWDTDDDRKGFDLPIYFAVGDDKTLTAGLKYSHAWDGTKADGSQKDSESTVSIVVGKTFSLNPK